MDSMGTEPEGDDELIWQDEYSYDLAGNRTEKAHTEALGNDEFELTLRHYKYNQANQLILEWKEEGSLTKGTVAGEVWDEESGLAKLTLNGVTPSMWGDYFYGEAPPSNGMVFVLAEDHVKNQTLIGINVTTGLSDFVGYSYDENGNLVERLSSEGPTVYQWDHRNRLTKVIHPDGSETSYEYCAACPLGKLSKMKRADASTVEWVWDGISFLREVDSQDALPMEYFGGFAVKREGAWYYLHADVMGTIWQVTDENGAIVNDFQWDAWGNELTGTFGQPGALCQIGWQGKRFDEEQGVFYSVARWYDERLGRFTQPDPAEGRGVVSVGGEGYGWPGLRPINTVDPTGMITDDWYGLQADPAPLLNLLDDLMNKAQNAWRKCGDFLVNFGNKKAESQLNYGCIKALQKLSDCIFGRGGTVSAIAVAKKKWSAYSHAGPASLPDLFDFSTGSPRAGDLSFNDMRQKCCKEFDDYLEKCGHSAGLSTSMKLPSLPILGNGLRSSPPTDIFAPKSTKPARLDF